ncbi:NUDIX hydrolase [Miniphocaeibacter halophilus]|uniref:NUDIX hydrolase n=1 Tax=Miniphocaeibacter halophilus TaxID=2931922 RepID=A0AC61MQD6_9FIRM|nr:NUDIX hydrolase [Miniphocaeibacter halophilus]QQK07895.1 NUDIX hydrolase [Miniphocaeibacter halophilus]
MEEVSAGGVVIHKGKVAVLRKFRGDWVLPKGRLEKGETREEAALREVNEEAGIKAEIVRYIGYVKYWYKHIDGMKVQKTVHYYYMTTKDSQLTPQREEGFTEAVYMPLDKAIHYIRHDAEKNMVRKVKEFYKKERKG